MTKNRWTLLPWGSLDRVVSVLTSGADKHGDAGWKERSMDEYLNAAMRHISEHLQGVTADHETGEPPLAHAVADLLIAMALEPVETVKPADILPHDIYGPITELPDWAEWVAVDIDGDVRVFAREPKFGPFGIWDANGFQSQLVNEIDPPTDWRQAKRRIKR